MVRAAQQSLDIGIYVNNRAAVFLEGYPMAKLLEMAVEAEALGFHSVWLGDSLLAKPRFSPLVTLGAVALADIAMAADLLEGLYQ